MEQKINKVFEDYCQYSDEIENCQFFAEFHPTDKNKLVVFINGEIGTIHEKGLYKVEFTFSDQYPAIRPEGLFVPPLPYHCNIGSNGSICLDYYNDWNSNYMKRNFNSLLEAICYWMSNQNPNSCLRSEIGQEEKSNRNQYIENVRMQALVCRQAFSQ